MAIDSLKNVHINNFQTSQPKTPAINIDITESASGMTENQQVESSALNDGSENENQRLDATGEQVKKAVSDINRKMSNTSCQFGIHEGTGRVTIKIIDKETKDVLKEFPAEETLEMIEKAWELAGILVDEKL